MSFTRPIDEPPKDYAEEPTAMDKLRDLLTIKGRGHSASQKIEIDNSKHKNDWGPWVTISNIVSAFALGLSISSMIVVYYMTSRSTVSENHWRNIETEVAVIQKQIERLERNGH